MDGARSGECDQPLSQQLQITEIVDSNLKIKIKMQKI
jgi:hypothetical protein